ncbi:hypothetical protein B0A48_04202 [Cryoendolithus antarcticus]|uniref:Uncharacterized protein n=1 Tax=Cryoendolithus antarcticus TaxID=1507870 RepID=A0A1V8TEP6_9PEZI|nr:hypothetical protein B0A48_04202 [Cryoendolithus antarcticus]
MSSSNKNTSIQAFFQPTPSTSPIKPAQTSNPISETIGDGFTATEVQNALRPAPSSLTDTWHPTAEYAECEIRDLQPGPRAVTFMGRVANIFDVGVGTGKTPKSAKGCVKLCVKDERAAVTVRVWWADEARYLAGLGKVRLGALVSVWTNHISNGESGNLSSMAAPLFASLFPERDRSCHLMIHSRSDDGSMLKRPLGHSDSRPLTGLMTLQNFVDGGYDVVDAKILVVVKSLVERKDTSVVDNMNVVVHDDTAEAILGLWGTVCCSPGTTLSTAPTNGATEDTLSTNPDVAKTAEPWKPGETVLLLQAPGFKLGSFTYLNLTSTTLIDVDPAMKDAVWLRNWALRQKYREAVNPPFPKGVFDLELLESSPLRCLYTLADLDEFARAAPGETFQGYLSVIVMEVRLLENYKRQMLFAGECCYMPLYANALAATCKGCDKSVNLRLSPKLLGQVIDETGAVTGGKLLLSDQAWTELLGRTPAQLLQMTCEQIKYLADRILFGRLTVLFGWTGDESKAGGRICVMGVRSG